MGRLRVGVVLVDAHLATCQSRVKARAAETGRDVPEHVVAQVHAAAKDAAYAMKDCVDVVDMWAHIDNNGLEPIILEDGCSQCDMKSFLVSKQGRQIV